MDVELINPFIISTVNVLKTMAGTDPVPGKPALKEGNLTWGVVTGLIGMAGEDTIGNMVISFDGPSVLSIVSKMLMDTFTEVNSDVTDAVGEITNMISGGTKKQLNEKGFSFHMATPVVIVGQNVELTQQSRSPIVAIPFTTPAGIFQVEANLSKREWKR